MAEGITYIERRNVLEIMRDGLPDLFEVQTGSAWRPRRLSPRSVTAQVMGEPRRSGS